jgi:hypothetical protein
MDISRVVSDVGSLTVKAPTKIETSTHDLQSSASNVELLGNPQTQVVKIVASAENVLKQYEASSHHSQDNQQAQQTVDETKGKKIDEYA